MKGINTQPYGVTFSCHLSIVAVKLKSFTLSSEKWCRTVLDCIQQWQIQEGGVVRGLKPPLMDVQLIRMEIYVRTPLFPGFRPPRKWLDPPLCKRVVHCSIYLRSVYELYRRVWSGMVLNGMPGTELMYFERIKDVLQRFDYMKTVSSWGERVVFPDLK